MDVGEFRFDQSPLVRRERHAAVDLVGLRTDEPVKIKPDAFHRRFRVAGFPNAVGVEVVELESVDAAADVVPPQKRFIRGREIKFLAADDRDGLRSVGHRELESLTVVRDAVPVDVLVGGGGFTDGISSRTQTVEDERPGRVGQHRDGADGRAGAVVAGQHEGHVFERPLARVLNAVVV